MLKFKNREMKTGKEFIYQISMSSVQGEGVVDGEWALVPKSLLAKGGIT